MSMLGVIYIDQFRWCMPLLGVHVILTSLDGYMHLLGIIYFDQFIWCMPLLGTTYSDQFRWVHTSLGVFF